MKSIIISSVLSLLLTGNSPVRFQYPSNIITTPYGTCTWYYSLSDLQNSTIGSIFNGMSFSSDAKMTIVNYTFNGQATGTFDLPVYSNVLTNNYKLFVQGGILLSVPDLDGDNTPDALRFRVNDTRQFTCLIIHPNWSQPATINLSIQNQNITINDTIEGNVADIMSYTSSINGYAQTINSSTTTIKNILTQALGSYVSQDGSLYTDMQTLINAFKFNNVPVGSYSAYSLFGFLGDLNRTDTDAMPYYIISDTAPQYMLYLTAGVDYYLSVIVENPSYYGMSSFIQVVDDQNSNAPSSMHYIDYNNLRSTYTMKIRPSRTASYRIKFTNDFNGYIYGKKLIPLYFGTLTDIDNDIAMLTHLPYQTNSLLKEAINAIKNMAVNVTNMTVNATGITYNTNQTQVDNSVTSYQNNINVVNNVENNFKDMFDNANQNYNINNIPITNDMINTNNFMNNVASQLYGIDIIKYPVTLLLLGIVLIGLLG